MGQDGAQVDFLAVGPQVLEGIELARLVVEDVDDDAAVVEQNPRAAAVALAVQRLLALFGQFLFHRVAQRVDLRVGRAGADDKVFRAEYFVICTGTSNTQINALCDAVEKELTEKGEEPLHREGYRGGTWVLLDYGCVVVHVFNDEARKFYSLEHLWADGEEVDLSAILPHAEEK